MPGAGPAADAVLHHHWHTSVSTLTWILPNPSSPKGEITGVVWVDPGGTTHNYAIGHRSQLLPFTAASKSADGRSGVLSITAPAQPSHAPPGFYLVFLLSKDLYSEGIWVQVREPAPKPLAGVVSPRARLVPGLSGGFEPRQGGARFRVAAGGGEGGAGVAHEVADAAGAGAGGMRLSLGPKAASARAVVASGAAWLNGGKNCTLMLWARGARPGQQISVGVFPKGGGAGKAALPFTTVNLTPGPRHCQFTLPVFAPPASGDYEIQIKADLTAWKPRVDFDDFEIQCLP